MTVCQIKSDYHNETKNTCVWSFCIASALLLIIVLYFVQINKIVESNFKLTSFQKIIREKEEQNQALQTTILQVHSLRGLGEKAKEMNLVSIDKTTYLKTISESFALVPTR